MLCQVISNVFSKSRAAAKSADGLDQILEYIARDETPIGVKERLLVCLEDTHGKVRTWEMKDRA